MSKHYAYIKDKESGKWKKVAVVDGKVTRPLSDGVGKFLQVRSGQKLSERIRARVTVCADTGCWNWNLSKDKGGYGRINVGGKTTTAHRASYAANKGPIPDGLVVMHSCDNPTCCNPDHLSLGTIADNVEDKMIKGRYRNGRSA